MMMKMMTASLLLLLLLHLLLIAAASGHTLPKPLPLAVSAVAPVVSPVADVSPAHPNQHHYLPFFSSYVVGSPRPRHRHHLWSNPQRRTCWLSERRSGAQLCGGGLMLFASSPKISSPKVGRGLFLP
jgi:hypothetical protein